MAKTITVQSNQSMADVILMAAGTIEAGWQFILDNNLSISDVPEQSASYNVSDTVVSLADADVMNYISKNKIVIGTLGLQQITNAELLSEDGTLAIISEDGQTIVLE